MQRTVPEFLFLEDGGRTGIGAIGNRIDQPLYSEKVSCLEKVQGHSQISVEHLGGVLQPELDSAHIGRAVQDVLRPQGLETLEGFCSIRQVDTQRERGSRVLQVIGIKLSADTFAEKASRSGH